MPCLPCSVLLRIHRVRRDRTAQMSGAGFTLVVAFLVEWLTPDLLARISGNPALQSGMSNPRFMAAIAELQKDPRAALRRFKVVG